MAAPVVIATRLSRMAAAGPAPSSRDQREFLRMGQEKLDASVESMWATTTGILSAYQQLCRALASSAQIGEAPKVAAVSSTLLTSWFQIIERSVVPFHRRVVNNERRLSK